MDNKVDSETSHQRMDKLLSLVEEHSRERAERHIGKAVRALVDTAEERDGRFYCTARAENSRLVRFLSDTDCVGEFVNVEIKRTSSFDLFGDGV